MLSVEPGIDDSTKPVKVSGYFDGHGNVGLEVVEHVIRLRQRFSDTWKPQIETIRSFVTGKGISSARIWHERTSGHFDAFRIDINATDSVPRAAKTMLPYCSKKAEDLKIVIDYPEGKITESQTIARFNEEVKIGGRSGFFRTQSVPYKREEGIRLAQLENARNARAAYAVNVSATTQDQTRRDHAELKLGFVRLGKKYGYSMHVIRRTLGAP